MIDARTTTVGFSGVVDRFEVMTQDVPDINKQIAFARDAASPVRITTPARGREARWDAQRGSYVYV